MSKHVVIAGGGTGGHLYPGVALAQALQKKDMSIAITFIGTSIGIESRVLPKEGFSLKTISSTGLLGKRGLSRAASLCKVPLGVFQAMAFLLRNRPGLVVGVGGYVSGPAGLAAKLLGIPLLLHEQNALPGVTNRLLGKIANTVAVSFAESKKFFPAAKVVETGNMIREEFCRDQVEPQAVNTEPFSILVLGGSQGAHSINQAMVDALKFLPHEKIFVTHQTGEKDYPTIKKMYQDAGASADVRPFIHDMAEQYKKASLIIARSGATTLAEITAMGKMSILIPFPYAAQNHQEKNARVLENESAAQIILDPDATGETFAQAIEEAMNNPDRRLKMETNSHRLGKRKATLKVRDLCMTLLTKGTGSLSDSKNNHGMSCF